MRSPEKSERVRWQSDQQVNVKTVNKESRRVGCVLEREGRGKVAVSHLGMLSDRLIAGPCQCFQTPGRGQTPSLGSPARTEPAPHPGKPQCQVGYQTSDPFFCSFHKNKIIKMLNMCPTTRQVLEVLMIKYCLCLQIVSITETNDRIESK